MGYLVLVRHGESRWNLTNRFTGWVDVPLSEKGIREAERVAAHCRKYAYAAAYTSDLSRAQETLLIILAGQNKTAVFQHDPVPGYEAWIKRSNLRDGDIPVFATVALNERYYGDLQGMNKRDTEKIYGLNQVLAWRRGYDDRPPGGETLAETHGRALSYLQKRVLPRVRRGEDILVVAHGNTLRGVIMQLEGISAKDIASVDLPEARPLTYKYFRGRFRRVEGKYRLGRPLR